MKKLTLVITICSVIVFGAYAQKNDAAEKRRVGTISGVETCCGIGVVLQKGNSSEITIKGTPEAIAALKTNVRNGVLKVSYDDKLRKGFKQKRVNVTVYASVNTLTEVGASSGGSVKSVVEFQVGKIEIEASSGGSVQLSLKAQKIDVDANSGAEIKLNVDAREVDVDANSGSSVTLKGNAGFADIDVSSGANVNAKGMLAGEVKADVNSAGKAVVSVKDALRAIVNSSGKLTYFGNPSQKSTSSNSGGKIISGGN